MIASKHADGPWSVIHRTATDNAFDVVSRGGMIVTACGRSASERGLIAANARIIAASVDFYDACTCVDTPLNALATVLDLMADLPTEYPEEGGALETCKRLLNALRAAVAKAEGRA